MYDVTPGQTVDLIDWRHRSACRNEDPELFFPTATTGTSLWEREVGKAKSVCERCPVVSACLAWALASGEDGVWGGTTLGERRALRGVDLVAPVVERRAA